MLSEKILKEKFRQPKLPLQKDLLDLITKILHKSPNQRPTIRELLQFQIVKTKAKQFKIDLPQSISSPKSLLKKQTTFTIQTQKILQTNRGL